MLDESFASEEYGICFRKDDTEMCAQVEEAFMQLVEDGTYVELAEKYGLDTAALCLASDAEATAEAEPAAEETAAAETEEAAE